MSKNVKSNNKNTKKSASKAKKSTRNNYKIESLEPRLMMDADSGFDAEHLNEYAEQIESISGNIGEQVSSAVNSIEGFDASKLGLAESVGSFTTMFGESVDSLKTTIADKVNTVLTQSLDQARTAIEQANANLAEGVDPISKLSLSELVDTYVKDFLESEQGEAYRGLTFSAEGSKLTVGIDLSETKSLENLGVDLGSWGKVSVDGAANLSATAQASVSVELDKDGSGSLLDSADDVEISAPQVDKLEVSVDIPGASAKFMNLSVSEIESADEANPDLSLSYTPDEGVTKNVDLEFKVGEIANLPFYVADEGVLKVSTNDGELDVQVPEFKLNKDFSLGTVLKSVAAKKLPILNSIKIPVGVGDQSEELSVAEVASELEDFWSFVPSAIYGSVENKAMNLVQLKSSVDSFVQAKAAEWGNVFGSYAFVGEGDSLPLSEGENSLVLRITPAAGSFDKLNLGKFSLEKVAVNTEIDVKFTFNMDAEGKITFSNVALQDLNVKMQKSGVESFSLEGISAAPNSGVFSLELSIVNRNNRLDVDKFDAQLTYDKLDLKANDTLLASLPQGAFSYANEKWTLPAEITNFTDLLSGDSFSMKNLLSAIGSVPYLANYKFAIAKKNPDKNEPKNYVLSVVDFAGKVDDAWKGISLALSGGVNEAVQGAENIAEGVAIDAARLKALFESVVGTNLSGLFDSVTFKMGENDAVDIFAEVIGEPTELPSIALNVGSNEFTLGFAKKNIAMDGFSINSFNVNAKADISAALKIKLNIDQSGKVTFGEFDISGFEVTVSLEDFADTSLTVSYADKKWQVSEFDFESLIEGISLSAILKPVIENFTNNKSIPNLDLKVKETQTTVLGILDSVSNTWENVSKALKASVSLLGSGDPKVAKLDADALRNKFASLVEKDGADEFKNIIDSVKIIPSDSVQEYNVWGRELQSAVLPTLTGKEYTFVFSLHETSLEKLKLPLFDLNSHLGVDSEIAIKVTINADDGKADYTLGLEKLGFGVDIGGAVQGLPFAISGDSSVKISYDVTNGWKVDYPEFELGGNFALKAAITSLLGNVDIPLEFKIGEEQKVVKDLALSIVSEAESAHNAIVQALYSGAAKLSTGATSSIDVTIETLKRALSDVLDSESIFKSVKIVKQGSNAGDSDNLCPVFGEGETAETVLKFSIDDSSQCAKLTFRFTPEKSLENVSFAGVNLGTVNMSCPFDVTLTLHNNNGLIELDSVDFDKMTLDVSQSLSGPISLPGDLTAELVSGLFKFKASIGTSGFAISECKLSYNSLELKYKNVTLLKQEKSADEGTDPFEIGYKDNKWNFPPEFTDLSGILEGTGLFDTIIEAAEAASTSIPYLGDSFKIGSDSYKVSEILKKISDFKNNVLLALRNQIAHSENKFTLDLKNAKEIFNNFLNSDPAIKSFFSEIKLNFGAISYDLLADTGIPTDLVDITGGKFTVEFCPEIEDVQTDLGNIRIDAALAIDITLGENAEGAVTFGVAFNQFELSAPGITSDTLNGLLKIDDDCLKLTVGGDGEVKISNVELNDELDVSDFLSLDGILEALENINIPFINEPKFSVLGQDYTIKQIAQNLNECWKIAQYGVYDAFADGKLDFNKIKDAFSGYVNGLVPLDKIQILTKEYSENWDGTNLVDLLVANSITAQSLSLEEGEHSLLFAISPKQLQLLGDGDVNLGIFDVASLSAECTVYLKLNIKVDKDGKLSINNVDLERVDLDFNTSLDSMNLGLFEVEIDGGKVDFSVSIGDGVKPKELKLGYSSLTLKAGDSFELPKITNEDGDNFSYNFDSREWTLPNSIKQYMSLSGDSLINQVHVVLNSLQSALRSLVESKTKLDFLDGSIDKVVDIVDKVEAVVYGDGSENCDFGLMKCVEGQYQKNFGNISTFVEVFNKSWRTVFGVDDNVVSLQPVEGENNIVLLDFALKFGVEKAFGLDLANVLKDKLENISTHGYVSIKADATISFNLKIDFSGEKLEKDAKLSEIGLFELDNEENPTKALREVDGVQKDISVNEWYITYEIPSEKTFDEDLFIKLTSNVKETEGRSELGIVKIKEGVSLSSLRSDWYENSPSETDFEISYTSSRQIVITSKQEFVIEKGDNLDKKTSGGDSFAELKLSGTNLQTMYKVQRDDEWTIHVLKSGEDSPKDVKIKNDFFQKLGDGYIQGKNLKDQLNEYLSIQNTIDEVDKGRSIMNTYGLYVVDVDEDNIIFGCDSRRIQGNLDTDNILYYLYDNGAEYGKKITYMRISGELTPSIGKHGALVASGTNKVFIEFDNAADDVDSVAEKFKDLYKKYVDSDVPDGLGNEFVFTIDSINLKFEKEEKGDAWCISLKSTDGASVEWFDHILELKFSDVNDDSETIYVNTEQCSSVSSLAKAIKDTIDNCTQDDDILSKISSVMVVDGNIVFSVNDEVKIVGTTEEIKADKNDFKIGDKKVDFQKDWNASDLKTLTLAELLANINAQLASDYIVEIVDDHLEIFGSQEFTLTSFGSSKALEWLGFSSGQKAKENAGDYRIVGSALQNLDWSKKISLEEIILGATLTVSMGTDLHEIEEVRKSGNSVTLELKSAEGDVRADVSYAVGGYIAVGSDYYKIENVDAEAGTLTVSTVSIEGNTLANADKKETWETAKYAASASASYKFVGADLIAKGVVGLELEFGLEKAEEKDPNNIFGYKVNPVTLEPVDGSNEFIATAYADLFGYDIELAEVTLEVVKPNGFAKFEDHSDSKLIQDNYRLASNVELGDGVKSILDSFKNFSIEKLYVVLENLIERIDDVTDKVKDQKIPVINKTVGDLVSVANDLRSIISTLRAEKITSLQQFGDLLNTYLEKFNLSSRTDGKKLFNIRFDKDYQAVFFDFDVVKAIGVRHRFSFGKEDSGVQGNIDLDVSGDFWFALSAKVVFGEEFDLVLTEPIQFGAEIAISGDKLNFDLGVTGGGSGMLSNLISVGENKDQQSFIHGKVAFLGSVSGKDSGSFSINDPKGVKIDYALPIVLFGRLPITVCEMSLGDVLVGRFNNNAVELVNCTSFDNAQDEVEKIMGAIKEDWKDGELTDANKVYDSFDFGLRLGNEDNKSQFDGRLIADFSSVYERILELADFANMDWFSQIKLAVSGLNNLFEMLESNINGGMASSIKSVPVVGSALSTGVDFLSELKNKVLDPFSKFVYESTGLTAEMVAKKMNDLFGLDSFLTPEYDVGSDDGDSYYFGWNGDKTGWKQVDGKGTWYRSSKESAEWYFNLGGVYEFGTSVGFDLGFPGLALAADGGLALSLSWALEFGFGISKQNGFYFIFNDGNEINVKATAELDADISASLAGLGLTLSTKGKDKDGNNHKAAVELSFGVDLNNPSDSSAETYDSRLGASEPLDADGVKEWIAKEKTDDDPDDKIKKFTKKYGLVKVSDAFAVPKFDFEATVDIYAGIDVGVGKDAGRDTPKFPNISGDFEFDWAFKEVSGVKKPTINSLAFKNLEFDMGSFIGGVLGPIVSKIQTVIEPLEPLIDFLMTPFPVLDDLGIKITPLDLAKKYSKGKFDDGMIYAIKDLISISKTISTSNGTGLKISLGDFELIKPVGDNSAANSFINGKSALSSINVDEYAPDQSGIKEAADKELKNQGFNIQGESSWNFIWNNPSKIFQMLLGEDVPLVEYTMPKLCFDFDWNTFVRIWGPLGARLGVTFNASIQLGFGYDTLGIRQWIASGRKDYGRLVNGFYVMDKDKNGVDVNELSFYGGLTAAAELNAGVSAGVGGGVGINVGFNLFDPNKDGKVRLSEMNQIIGELGLFGIFDVNGAITAKLYAYVDLWLTTKKWNITGDITLFSFNYEHKLAPVMASKDDKGNIVAHIGPNAGDRVSTDKDNPTLEDGNETYIAELTDKGEVKWGDGKKVSTDKGNWHRINGDAGDDYIKLTGKAGLNLEIYGGEGDDVIDLSELDLNGYTAIIVGGAGNDIIIGAKEGMNIIYGDGGYVPPDEDEGRKTGKFYVEGYVEAGAAGNDTIVGGKSADVIFGGAGNDKIDGLDGDDLIFGDGGKALYDNGTVGGASRSDISLDGGDDLIIGGEGNDTVFGGSGNDRIDGGVGDDEIHGERGNDRIFGGSGTDKIYGGSGHDIINGDKVETIKVTDNFNKDFFSKELIANQFSKDNYTVSDSEFKFDVDSDEKLKKWENKLEKSHSVASNNDSGSDGIDHIYGGEGDDLIYGAGGNDVIEGGIGNDVIDGGNGDDNIQGGIDNDIIYGGEGDDVIDGGAGNDSLYGDKGVASGYTKGSDAFNGEKITFGENLGLGGIFYKDAKSGPTDGNDKIKTGPGLDFVDGQGGSDQIFVNLMGGSETSYVNITDSGEGQFDRDVLTIEATEYADNLLMRMNEAGTLGFVALLPEDGNVSSTNANKNIERVNFTNGIDVVNLYANGGDDKVVVDGTAAVTNIDGGAGNDTFQVGQLYNSDRKAGTQSIASEDGFKTIQNSDGKYLSEGVSDGSKLSIDGGIGDDTFTALRNVGSLNMAGSRGNDAFSVYNYKTMSGDIVVNGTRSIDGGNGIDSVNVYGTEGDDTVVITKEGLLSESGGIKVAGVEYSNFAAGAGDDEFYVASNNAGETTTINGGHGNDTVSVGGLDLDSRPLRNADTDGQTNSLTYEVLSADSDDLDDEQKENCFVNPDLEDKKYQQKFVVMDTSGAPVVFVSTSDTYIENKPVEITEGAAEASFFVGYSGNLKEGRIEVELNIPMLSTSMLQAGDRGILIMDPADSVYKDKVKLVFNSGDVPKEIKIKALSDSLLEDDAVKSISLKSIWYYTNEGNDQEILLEKSASAFSLNVKDDGKLTQDTEKKHLLTRTEEFKINGAKVALGEFGVELYESKTNSVAEIHVYLENSDKVITYDIDKSGVLTITNYTNDLENKTLIVNYRTDKMKLDGSKIHLAYDDVASLSSVKYGTETVYCGADKASKEKKDIYYELNGNVLVFFNTSNQQLATLHGEVSVGSGTFAGAETNIQNGDSFKPCDFLTIKRVGDTAQQNQYVLAEKYLETELEDGHHVPTGNTERDTSWNSMTFDITYNKDVPDGKSLFVKVSASEVISKMLDGNKEVQLLIYDNKDGIAKSSVVLEFKKGSASNTITVFAKADAIDEEYGVVTFDGNSDKRINQVEGIVDAYGKGTSDIAGVDNPELLHYNHKIESDSGFVWASKFNEKNTYDLDSLAGVKSVSGNTVVVEIKEGETPTKGGTVKFVSEKNESEWFRIDGDPIVGEGTYTLTLNKSIEASLNGFKAMFAGQKDYLFESEDDCVDRIFVNNQDSNVDANSALENADVENVDDSVKFTHTELKEKVVASEFEFGEFNLGTGKDTVNISKTIHGHVDQTTEKEFQTFTVVNTGDDKTDNREIDDDITVTDYNANDGQLVINAQGGNDKITAKGSLITKDGMVVLGGAGNDTIDVDKGIIAFGDKGNIQYMDGNNVVTELGYYKEDSGEHKAGDVIFTTIPKDRDRNFIQKQTDGIARGATSIASVMPNEGGVDKITAGGQMSVVVGGFGGDNITVAGEKNVVLGDNGVVNFHNEGSATSWRENNIVVSLEKVQTTNNSIGEKDTIGIVGSHNVVMGGNGDDDITIGEAGKGNGTDNVVLGDGGVANFTPGVATTENFMVNAAVESVKTEEDSVGAGDTIEIYGGQNTVMGGAGADIITIGEENKDDSEEVKINGDKNVVLGDGGSYVVDKDKGEVKVHTHDLSVTEDKEPDFVDTITIHGGQNTVMGGVAGDTIDIYGADNIVLGDGGESIREWNADNEVYDSIKSVETTDDSNGGIDTINIHGGKNAVMGGAKGDKITIGDEVEEGKPQNGNENVVLGDGGSYVVDKDKGEVTVKTSREEVDDSVVIHGGEDTIKIYGGQNTVMGGAMGDGIDIYGADNIVLGDGGIAVREWNSEKKVYEAIKSVKTTDDENGGVDTINIYGGQNAVMGGFDGDNITIGTQNGATSDNNIVLGDGGEYNNEASDSAYIQTQSDGIGGEDHIKVFGGNNVAMGGFADDDIEIHGGENVVLGDGGVANYDKKPDAATVNEFINSGLRYVETTSDDIGGHDDIDIFGDTNVVMGGADGDIIDIFGNDNVVVGDGGRYDIYDTYRTVQTKSEQDGGHDVIHTNDGKNIVMGGMDSDEITTGAGNDIILGDGGFAKVDRDFNAIYVTNEGRNTETLDKDEQVIVREDGTAGADTIIAGNGDNVVFGGLDSDDITTGNGQDVVFGDNAYATFRGNANEAFEQVGDRQNVPDVYEEATLSFNFQGASQTGLNAGDFVGAYNEQYGDDYRSSNWNNISGSLAGTYGNDDREVVNMDNLDATGEKSADETRVRASGVSVSYGGIESHRNTSTDNRINLQAYNLGLWNAQYDKNAKLMNSGLMTTAPNAQCENKLDVQMDGLAQYFTSYRVVVYLDIPDSHSAANNSVRKVSLYTNDSEDPIKTFYVKDNAGHNFHGSYERSTAETAASAMVANYVVFTLDEGVAADRIRVVIEEADPNAQNGKNLPGIAAIQVRGTLHKQDVAATTDIDFGGNDTIRTDLGDDIVVGGTGSDDITTFGDERYGIHDNDVVFGDNAKILLTDRDSDESTASTISTAESVAITNIDAIYDDLIKTGNGNDTVVGGVGADTINAEATAAADTMLEDINVLSINFTREHSDSTDAIAQGEAAGVVVDTDWHNFYRNDRGVIVSESVRGQESSPEYNNKMNSLSNNPTASNPYAVEEGVEVQLYGKNHGQRQTVASFTIENYDELDGDTSNSKLFNTYLAAQQSEEIVLKLKNMNSFVSNSNNTVSSTYDLYIYLGGDNNDTDTYNYLYQVKFTGHNGESQYRYLNDWTGHKFDGDYKEATCSSQTEAERMLQMALNESAHDSAAPRLELVGNYVVFRGVSGDVADIRIKNIYTSSGQHPKNLPMISAVQVVSGDGRYAGETDLGGDHDKDLVYGDDAKLVFDMDVPYDADVADVSKFKNRVIEAKSVAIEHDAVTSISTNDTITTGRDRDVAVGGEGADTITMGAGDDIALGGSANLVLEHNNPLGVFTPNTEIALDQHTIDTTQHQNYLDNDNANKWQFQSRLDQNHIQGIDTSVSNENDRKDTIDVGEGRNLTSQGSDSTAQLVVPKPVIVDDDGQEGSGEASTPTPPVSGQDSVRQFVLGQREVMSYVEISAGQTVEIVLTDWNEGDQYYHPNIVLQMSATDNVRHNLSVTWDGLEEPKQVSLLSYGIVDIPDSANVVGEHKIVLRVTCDDDIVFMASAGQR